MEKLVRKLIGNSGEDHNGEKVLYSSMVGILLLSFLLAGCGAGQKKSSQEGTDAEGNGQGKTSAVHYVVEEQTIPDAETGMVLPDGSKYVQSKVQLYPHSIVENGIEYDNDGRYVGSYTQVWNDDTEQWKHVENDNTGFDIDDVACERITTENMESADGILYGTGYEENEAQAVVKIENGGVAEVTALIPDDLKKEWETAVTFRNRMGNYFRYQNSSNLISCYDEKLNKSDTVETTAKMIYGMLQGGEVTATYWYGISRNNKAVAGSTDGDIIFEDFEGVGTDYKAAVSEDNIFYLADTQSVYMVTDGTPEKIFSFVPEGFLLSELYGMAAGEEGELRFLVKMDGECTLLTMKREENSVEKQDIVIACSEKHPGLERSIARFNRQSTKYRMQVLLPDNEEEKEEFLRQIQLAMETGEGPDILAYGLVNDMEAYVDSGYLECLDDVIENPSQYVEAALDENRIDGKLYAIPFEFNLSYAAYDREEVGNRTSWTLSELMEAVENSDAEILEKNLDWYWLVMRYGLFDDSQKDFIDWEKRESHLDEQPFLDFLAFAKKYADSDNVERKAFAESPTYFMDFSDMARSYAHFNGKVAFLGYPREKGNGFYVTTRQLYVNALSQKKEGAMEFLHFLISGSEQKNYVKYKFQQIEDQVAGNTILFPVSLEAYDTLVAIERERGRSIIYYTPDGYPIDFGEDKNGDRIGYPDDLVEQFTYMINHAEPVPVEIENIWGMVYEELEPYFSGDISAKEAAEHLQNRVQLYLNER